MNDIQLIKQIIPAKNYSLAEFDKCKVPLDFFGECLSEDEIKQVLGRKGKVVIPQLYYLVSKFNGVNRFEKEFLIPVNIGTTDMRFEVLGNQKTISNIIKQACKIKLLSCIKDKYSFGSLKDKKSNDDSKGYVINNKCYEILGSIMSNDIGIRYRYNDIISSYNFKFLHLSSNIRDSLISSTLEHAQKVDNLNPKDVKFSSKLNIKTSLSDDEIKQILYSNYPQLMEGFDDVNYVNEHYLTEDCIQRRFEPKIKRNKKNAITGISIRDTSSISNLKTHFNSLEDRESYNKLTREVFLEDYFGGKEGDKYYEYDVKSSIYRITYFLNNGVGLDDSKDLYSMIYGEEFQDSDFRNSYKKFCMSIYFDSESAAQIYSHFCYNNDNVKRLNKNDIIELIKQSRDKMEVTIGKRFDNEIFMHESLIYAKLNRALGERGFNTIQIYDGFYIECKGLSREEINSVCKEELIKITEDYKNKFMK